MSNDDDMLEQFDLSAWEAPPPPADLADGVIDRMGGTDVGIAAVSVDDHRAPRRAWIIAGAAVAAIVLAIGVWSLIRATHHAAPTTGGVVADKPRSLALDTVHATLDAGADVRWRRDGNVLRVEQRAGTVMWHVDADENLVIDAGAASASVQATGANLRVEVQMNATDARVIGGVALTAAAVAMVTVVVYEGHVKVGKPNQQLVVVSPGSTYKVNAVDDTPTVGAAPAAKQKVVVLGLELVGSSDGDAPVVTHVLSASMRAVAAKLGPYALAPGSDKELVDVKLLFNCTNENVQCMAAVGADLGADVLVYGHVERSGNTYGVNAKLLDVAAKQIKRSETVLMPVADAEADKLDEYARKLYLSLVGVATACDAEALKDQGMQMLNTGQHAAALARFEESLACKDDLYVAQLAFMESCATNNSAKAKLHFKRLTPTQQTKFSQMCIRTNTPYEDDVATAGDDCKRVDEVTCVLNNYEGDCCKKYVKQSPGDNDSLTRSQIATAIAKVKPQVLDCQGHTSGKVIVRVQVLPAGSVQNIEITTTPDPALGMCVARSLYKTKFPKTKRGGAFSYPFIFTAKSSPKGCDAKKLMADAKEQYANGQHQAASALLEQAIACETSTESYELALMNACTLKDTQKIAKYWKRLPPASQNKLKQVCLRNGIDPTDVPAAATCDADALKDAAMESINLGQHAAALAKLESSLACKKDAYVTQLAFMESCASANAVKAKQYYKQMSTSSQQKFAQMCKRNKVDYLDGPVGYLEIDSQPPAKIFIDGNDSGLVTPIRGQGIELTPGKHKITFLVDGERFTYPVVIKAGETQTMSKDLR